MKTVRLTTEGIKKHLGSTTPVQALIEYVWNGLDAKATCVSVSCTCNEAGGVEEVFVSDNGKGIPFGRLDEKFGVFLDSEKIRQRQASKRLSSETHGKDGIGRLTFFVFAQMAQWKTVYEDNGKKFSYSIDVIEGDLKNYKYTNPVQVGDDIDSGTVVIFKNIISSKFDLDSSSFREYMVCEFCWKLLLQEDLRIIVNGDELNPLDNVDESTDYCPLGISGAVARVRVVRWKNKLHHEYSRYYFINSSGVEKYTDFTSLNKKSDNFFHSVYVVSEFFDNFVPAGGASDQLSLELEVGSKKSDWFKVLINAVDGFLRELRKEFLRQSKEQLIDHFEEKGILPKYNRRNMWEAVKHDHLAETVGELYNIQPSLFSGGTIYQKKILVRLIDQLLDADEAENLYKIIEQVVELDSQEKQELLGVLNSSRLRSVIRTAKLIQDRYRALEQLKKLNWDFDLGAMEVPHIQNFMENHFWIMGEQYSLVVAAEKDFEQALRGLYKRLEKEGGAGSIVHPDKNKEMDILLVRQDKQHDRIHNVVLELKHPNKKLGKKFVQQIETYFEVISSEPRFNGTNMEWSYYLIGNAFDSTGYIENQLENAKPHGEKSLIYKVKNHKIYVKLWSEIILDAELRHKFLNDRLEVQREVLAAEESQVRNADDVIKRAQALSCATGSV